jgi:hypothetical protein
MLHWNEHVPPPFHHLNLNTIIAALQMQLCLQVLTCTATQLLLLIQQTMTQSCMGKSR